MTPILLLPPAASDESVRLWEAALRAGWRVERATGWRPPAGLAAETGSLVIYGGELLARAMQDALACHPRPLPAADWLPGLPPDLLRREVVLAHADRLPPLAAPRFLKPVHAKWFAAGVYPIGHVLPPDAPDEDKQVYVAEPVRFLHEWRLFVAEAGRISTASRYAVGGQPAAPTDEGRDAAVAFGAQVLATAAGRRLPPVALDVGWIDGRGWAVVELNPIAESALYGADPDAVLQALRAAYRR